MTADQPSAPAAAPRRWRAARRALLALAVLLLALLALLWWWSGTAASLAFALTHAARYLPEGQSLQVRDVTGSLRAGGRIGWLRYGSPTLALEVSDARIGWRLAPLLERQVQLTELRAAQITLAPQGPPGAQPAEPLAQLTLPVRVQLPFFQIDRIAWAAHQPLHIGGLTGSYRYDGEQHRLTIDSATLAQGQYALQATLQAQAPMALHATLRASLNAPVPGGAQPLQAQAEAAIEGTLATRDAHLQASAQLLGQSPGAGAAAPRADAQARIAPWAAQPLLQASASLQAFNLATLWPQAPTTQLSGSAALEPEGDHGWRIQADLRNALPGPWNAQRLPIDALQARATFDGSTWSVPQATLRLGQGSVSAQGAYTPATQALQASARVQALAPSGVHSAFDAAPLSGTASAQGQIGDLRLTADLRAADDAPRRANALRIDRLAAEGTWRGPRIDIARLELDALQAQVRAQGLRIDTAAASAQGQAQASAPGLSASVNGQIAARGGAGALTLHLADAQRAQRWLAALPFAPALPPWHLQGNADFTARWNGGWQTLQRQLHAAGLAANTASAPPTPASTNNGFELNAELRAPRLRATRDAVQLELLNAAATLRGTLPRMDIAFDGALRHNATQADLHLRASAASPSPGRWQARVGALRAQATAQGHGGPWRAQLTDTLTIDAQLTPHLQVDASAGQLHITGPQPGQAVLRWQPMRYARQTGGALQLRSQGELRDLPLAWAAAFVPQETTIPAGDLTLRADWDITAADTLRARATIQRAGGDLLLPAGNAAPGTPAGLRQLQLHIDATEGDLRARADWDSDRLGQLHAEGSTRLTHAEGGWLWPADAPLAASVRAALPDVGVWSALAPPGWRVRGSFAADAQLSGSRAAPRWSGQIAADQLAARSQIDGIDLRDGRLRAQLDGDRLDITELSAKGGPGSRARIPGYSGNRTAAPKDGGSLSASGSLSWTGGAIGMDLHAQARALQVLARADRQVSVSGNLRAQLQDGQFTLRGQLTADRATLLLPEAGTPELGNDVVVRSAALDRADDDAKAAAQSTGRIQAARPPDIALTLDLGHDFALQGHGITTRLTGKLDIRSAAGQPPRVTGEIHTDQGRYRAWGQSLDVESGLLRFSGPYDNPALDILALRPNISARAGVQVSGTAKAPRVRLYAEPDLPDAEKLSWVVFGRASAASAASAANAASGADSALLQQAALALLGGSGGDGIAKTLGLDEIGLKGPNSASSGADASAAALTLGKRISKDLYMTYERGLSGVMGTLYIFYDLSRRLTLRGQTGVQNGLDLIYTMRYD